MTGEKPSARVLVVDDESLIRWSVAQTVAAMGMTVEQARDGASAVSCIENQGPFDVIVLDYRLPDSDDLALLSRVRRLAPAAAVIMMTAFHTPEMTEDALNLGCYRVVSKPFELHDMGELVKIAQTQGTR